MPKLTPTSSSRRAVWILLGCLLYGGFSCTQNPFDDQAEITSKNKLSGFIELEGDADARNVYVWLDIFDLGNFTDARGHFQLELPPPEQQPHGGYTGQVNLYFYSANYQIDSTSLIIRRGEFLFPQGLTDEAGQFRNPVTLEKLLDVTVTVDPAAFSTDDNAPVEIFVNLCATRHPVEILTTETNDREIAVFLAERTDTSDGGFFPINTDAYREVFRLVENETEIWESYFIPASVRLPEGEYRMLPYIWVRQRGLPRRLIESLGIPFEQFSPAYGNLPFQRHGDGFFVTTPEDSTVNLY